MKIAIINGSIRKGRKSIRVSHYLTQLIQEMGVEVNLLDIGEYNFPVMEERHRFLKQAPEGMDRFSQTMLDADGLIIVTPEYNGSYSGALKNTLDYFKAEYQKKAMGLVAVSDGRMGGANAMHHLQAWAIHVKGIVSPYKLFVDRVDQKFSENGMLSDDTMKRKVELFLNEFLWLTRAISAQL